MRPCQIRRIVGPRQTAETRRANHGVTNFQDPALLAALDSQAFYIGALGSKKTHQKRRMRLKEPGCTDEMIDTIKSPVGLSIGSQSPEEIALAIMAEIVAVKYGLE